MKQPLFIKNSPIDEKRIAFIERIVARLARRTRVKAKAMITPYPISNAIRGEDVKGPVLCYMFPCAGKITKGLIDIRKKLREGALVEIDVRNSAHGVSKSYTMNRDTFLCEPQIEVDSGDQLVVTVIPNNRDDKIEEIWTSFLWVPSVKDIEVKSFLIDELENDLIEEEN